MTDLHTHHRGDDTTSGPEVSLVGNRDSTSSTTEEEFSGVLAGAVLGMRVGYLVSSSSSSILSPLTGLFQSAAGSANSLRSRLQPRTFAYAVGTYGSTADTTTPHIWGEFPVSGVRRNRRIRTRRFAELSILFVILGLGVLALSFANPRVPANLIGADGVRLNSAMPTFVVGELILLLSGIFGWLYGRRR